MGNCVISELLWVEKVVTSFYTAFAILQILCDAGNKPSSSIHFGLGAVLECMKFLTGNSQLRLPSNFPHSFVIDLAVLSNFPVAPLSPQDLG